MKLRKLFTVLLIVIIVLLVIPTTVSTLSVNQNSNENSIETPLFTEEELESFFNRNVSITMKILALGPFATIMKKAVPAILPQPNRESEYLPKE